MNLRRFSTKRLMIVDRNIAVVQGQKRAAEKGRLTKSIHDFYCDYENVWYVIYNGSTLKLYGCFAVN